MIGAALSDLHLGFRQFQATTDSRNARERDVELAWERAVDEIIAAGPILVTIAGDIFHTVRPSMHAIRAWQQGVRRIVRELPEAHVVAILGNHETPRTLETLTPVVVVDGEPRVHVVTQPKRIRLQTSHWIGEAHETISVACLPFVALAAEETYRLDPDPAASVNVLLLHAAVRGGEDGNALPRFYAGDTALDIAREAERWDVVHAGDFHTFTRLHPSALAFYSGAIERTTSDIWSEIAPKGLAIYDTAAGTLEHREIPARHVDSYDLDDILGGYEATADRVNRALANLADASGLDGAVVRLLVLDLPRAERGSIDQALIRRLRDRCLHFRLELRYAADERTPLGDRREGRGLTLEEEAAAWMADEPEDVRECALQYLGAEVAG